MTALESNLPHRRSRWRGPGCAPARQAQRIPKMPGCAPVEVLRRLRGSDRYKAIPVLIVTSSDSPTHLSQAARAGRQLLPQAAELSKTAVCSNCASRLPARARLQPVPALYPDAAKRAVHHAVGMFAQQLLDHILESYFLFPPPVAHRRHIEQLDRICQPSFRQFFS